MVTTNQTSGLIVIDGIDGAGKGVQSRALLQCLQQAGYRAILTREPGGSEGAEEIRRLLVEGEPQRWDALTELLLMYAARRSHLVNTIWPALDEGCWVISDRFADSSRVYQGIAGQAGREVVEKIHHLTVGDFIPDLTIILDLDPAMALARTEARGHGKESRFERKGVAFFHKVRAAFCDIAQTCPERYALIDASQSVEIVAQNILERVTYQFPHLKLSCRP